MTIEQWESERNRLNTLVLDDAGQVTKRFYSLDHQTYRDGALDARTKELLGLVASAVLRCDDCITYHIRQCHELGFSTAEVDEAMSVALIVGGSIVIPHHRRAMDRWRELVEEGEKK